MCQNGHKCVTPQIYLFVRAWQNQCKSFYLDVQCFLNQKIHTGLLHVVFDRDFLYIRTFVAVVLDFAIVVDDFFGNFGLEIVIDLSCFVCDDVDCFNYGWSVSVFANIVDFVMMAVHFVHFIDSNSVQVLRRRFFLDIE